MAFQINKSNKKRTCLVLQSSLGWWSKLQNDEYQSESCQVTVAQCDGYNLVEMTSGGDALEDCSLCCGDLDGPPVPEELLLWKNDTAVHGVNLCCTFESSWHHGSPYTFPFDIFWSAHEQGKSCVIWLSGVSKSLGFASWRKHFGDRCMASAHAQAFLSTCPKRPGRQFLWCVRT